MNPLASARQLQSCTGLTGWHEWSDGGLNVWTGADDIKVRHLRRDPRATIVIAEAEGAVRGIEIRGVAEVIGEHARETGRRIAGRYLGEEGRGYVDGMEGAAAVTRLAPGVVRAWHFADER